MLYQFAIKKPTPDIKNIDNSVYHIIPRKIPNQFSRNLKGVMVYSGAAKGSSERVDKCLVYCFGTGRYSNMNKTYDIKISLRHRNEKVNKNIATMHFPLSKM